MAMKRYKIKDPAMLREFADCMANAEDVRLLKTLSVTWSNALYYDPQKDMNAYIEMGRQATFTFGKSGKERRRAQLLWARKFIAEKRLKAE